jgi:hemoglobin
MPQIVCEESISDLISCFYSKVRRDDVLGPVFAAKIAADQWPAHLARMCDFWSAVMLGTRRFKGNPLLKHAAIRDLREPMFDRWLVLFGETADEIFNSTAAAEFRDKAARIGASLRSGVFRTPAAFAGGGDWVRG